MNRILVTFVCVLLAGHLCAQTNTPPARLAIVGDSPEAAPIVDVLTVEFSKDDRVQLLERAEIEKVIREQQLSLNNLDGLKLGRLLGADGVLFLSPVTEAVTNKFLDTRFVAVKPGVVLAAERFKSPDNDLTGWAPQYVSYLRPYVAKLGVLAKDAIPVSVVNFRSAVSASDAAVTERQLQTLAVERLSREPRLFVLERQKMQQLADEKNMSADESAFWNGAWLLEGVIDQNGFSKDTITLNARLTPAKGGTPVLLEASGSRTNFAEVINQLAAKVTAALQVSPAAKEFNAADEAAQFFSEAQWAMSWGELNEAHAAAEASWALGKQDEACAIIRVKSLIAGLKPLHLSGRGFAGSNVIATPSGNAAVAEELRECAQSHSAVFITTNSQGISYAYVDADTNQAALNDATLALETYYEFSRNAPQGMAGLLASDKDNRRNSGWYQLGLESLDTASDVLEGFNLVSPVSEPIASKLAGLRTEARAVAELIFEVPSVHDSYYVSNRIATYDELATLSGVRTDIFTCMINRGCLWQERPEDAIALYHKLMESPVYCYIQADLWHRQNWPPRLVAWDDEGRQRIPRVWGDFIRELDGSTNLLWRLEAHALQLGDIEDEQKAAVAFTNFFEEIISNRTELIANPVDVTYDINWDGGNLSKDPCDNGVYSEIRERLSRSYYSHYMSQLEGMEQEYRNKTVPAAKASAVFERQKRYLRDNEPYDFTEFVTVFQEKSYSPAQAQEILPLVIAYKSNMLAKAETADRMQKFSLQSDASSVEVFLQHDVENIAHPAPPPKPAVQNMVTTTPPPPPPRAAVPLKPEVGSNPPATVTNIIPVDKYLAIPLDGLFADGILNVQITREHWIEGKLVLDLDCESPYGGLPNRCIALLDPASEHWQTIACPRQEEVIDNSFYHRTTLWRGQVFSSFGNKVKRFDAASNNWQDLDLPDVGNCELFSVNDRLYAANGNMIIEILDGAGTRILASTRRQPPVCALDTENLGTPTLFAGPGGTLRAALAAKIYSWDETNWTDLCAAPPNRLPAIITDEAVMFFGDGWNSDAGIWRLPSGANQVEYCMGQSRESEGMAIGGPPRPPKPKPQWTAPKDLRLERLAVASHGSEIYLLTGRARVEDVVDERQHLIIGKKILPQYGYHAELFCYSSNYPAPQKIYLKFDATDMTVPVGNDSDKRSFMPPGMPGSMNTGSWIFAGGNKLFIGRSGSAGAYQTNAGVWVASLEQIESEADRQKKLQTGQLAQMSAANKAAAKAILDQFDWNHDGVIDGEEKEAALTNKDYIVWQLDQIDTNQNGLLDPAELKFFDANSNNVLDVNEAQGIEIAQRLLAERLVRKYDADGNGLLDRREFENLTQACLDQQSRMRMGNPFPDENHDNFMDVEEVKDFLMAQTEREVESATGVHWVMGFGAAAQHAELFKRDVEDYWQNSHRPYRPGFRDPTSPPFIRPLPQSRSSTNQ